MDARTRDAILALPGRAWRPAVNADRRAARGRLGGRAECQVALHTWAQGSRLIMRPERPHPGAQLSVSDVDGHRFQWFITDQPGDELAALEGRHRANAIVEDRVRTRENTGLANLPFSAFESRLRRAKGSSVSPLGDAPVFA